MAVPYRVNLVSAAINSIPTTQLTWGTEQAWVNEAWGENSKKAMESVEESLNEITFALNLFDRAAQEQKPGEIAGVFREILSVEVAVEKGNSIYLDDLAERDIQLMLENGKYPDTSSISLGRAWSIVKENKDRCAAIRYDEDGKLRKLKISSTN